MFLKEGEGQMEIKGKKVKTGKRLGDGLFKNKNEKRFSELDFLHISLKWSYDFFFFIDQDRADHWANVWDVYFRRFCMHWRQLVGNSSKWRMQDAFFLLLKQVSKATWKLFESTGCSEGKLSKQEITCQSSHSKSQAFVYARDTISHDWTR